MCKKIALTTIVTGSVLEEFKLLKFSWEMFHGPDYHWYVRCDEAARAALSNDRNVTCLVFTESVTRRPAVTSQPFWNIAAQKMNTMEDAWKESDWDAVIYLDADLIITASLLDSVFPLDGARLVLTPHFFPAPEDDFAEKYQREAKEGYFNSGFVVTDDKEFHTWWRNTYVSRVGKWFGDQRCLSSARGHFIVKMLDESANIGFWRTPFRSIPLFKAIPQNCKFLHCHLFQPLRTQLEWLNRMFALHCLEFLRSSAVLEHRIIYEQVIARDSAKWFQSSFSLRDGKNLSFDQRSQPPENAPAR